MAFLLDLSLNMKPWTYFVPLHWGSLWLSTVPQIPLTSAHRSSGKIRRYSKNTHSHSLLRKSPDQLTWSHTDKSALSIMNLLQKYSHCQIKAQHYCVCYSGPLRRHVTSTYTKYSTWRTVDSLATECGKARALGSLPFSSEAAGTDMQSTLSSNCLEIPLHQLALCCFEFQRFSPFIDAETNYVDNP